MGCRRLLDSFDQVQTKNPRNARGLVDRLDGPGVITQVWEELYRPGPRPGCAAASAARVRPLY
jgi:hypothetical protein